MAQGIYCYIDKKNNKIVYIGKDSHIEKDRRHKTHIRSSKYNEQVINRVIQNNPERYEYKILEKGNISQTLLNSLEISFIQKYDPIFNFTKGGDGVAGYTHSDEAKNKISNSLKGHKISNETRLKISNSLKGKKMSKETIKKMSESRKGRKVSKECRKKISESLMGRKFSDKRKKNISIGISKATNSSGYYRVSKAKGPTYKQGFTWVYIWYENKKQKKLSSTDIKKLEKKVKEKGLPWIKIDEVK